MPPAIRATLAVRRALVATCDRASPDPALLPDHAVAIDGGVVAWIGPDAGAAGARSTSPPRRSSTPMAGSSPRASSTPTPTWSSATTARAPRSSARSRPGGPTPRSPAPGGGIRATMRATRAAPDEELLRTALARARRLLSWGVTTVEVKSGYGESVREELRLLRVVRELGRALAGQVDVVATALPLHAIPTGRDRAGWVREVIERPPARSRPGASRRGLRRLRVLDRLRGGRGEARPAGGARPRARAAAARRPARGRSAPPSWPPSSGASSADHLEHVSQAGIAALARGGVVAGLLPASTLLLRGSTFAPGRRARRRRRRRRARHQRQPGLGDEREPRALALASPAWKTGSRPVKPCGPPAGAAPGRFAAKRRGGSPQGPPRTWCSGGRGRLPTSAGTRRSTTSSRS